jgi:hypothetical protein
MAPVRRVSRGTASAALLDSGEPLVLSGMIEEWPARRWTPESLGRDFGATQVCVRLHPGVRMAVWEGECVQERVSLHELSAWLAGSSAGGALSRYARGLYVAYADYQDMGAIFCSSEGHGHGALSAVDWSTVGVPHDGRQSTLWLGSEGAHTPIHQDCYGWNIVAQLHGTKRWRLHPPADPCLSPTRIPYEESSVFAHGGPSAEISNDKKGADTDLMRETTLSPGEVLLVPKHWWHHVVTTSPASISVNTWVDAPDDKDDRLREALVRVAACALMQQAGEEAAGPVAKPEERDTICPQNHLEVATSPCEPTIAAPHPASAVPWLNPTEEVWAHADSLRALRTALAEAHPECADSAQRINTSDIVDALCTGPALDAAIQALRRRCDTIRKRRRESE